MMALFLFNAMIMNQHILKFYVIQFLEKRIIETQSIGIEPTQGKL